LIVDGPEDKNYSLVNLVAESGDFDKKH
jgi:hypothetical protein